MYDLFEQPARKVMQLATQEAQRSNHEHIGTGQILLALIAERRCVAARALNRVGCDLIEARREVAKIVESASHSVVGRVPLNLCAKQSVEFALIESEKLNETLVRTEHLLLGILRIQDSVAVQALDRLGLSVNEVRKAIFDEQRDVEGDDVSNDRRDIIS
jgi:ATP-dependent Clp protease ATP-binding subunit ClpC